MEKDEQPLVGGRYEIRNGKRVLVEEPTKDHPEGNRARFADGTPVPPPNPEQAPSQKADEPAPAPRRPAPKGAK